MLAAEADDSLSTAPLLLVARVVYADFAASKVSRKAEISRESGVRIRSRT
jgi:hypothetical protein